jgi:UDP-3-O-[3-hydroxymyristoyl] glucosamine N-acyltransferase
VIAKIEKSLKEIAEFIDGEVIGDSGLSVSGACGIEHAGPQDLIFVSSPKYVKSALDSPAQAVIVDKKTTIAGKSVIQTTNPSKAFLKVMQLWDSGNARLKQAGIHPNSFIHKTAILGKNVYIGPGVVVEAGVKIGDGSSVLANSVIGERCILGDDVLIYENVTLRDDTRIDARTIIHSGVVIGTDGFGYEMIDGKHVKIPQTGNVWIGEDVEIGSNTCIDRARFGTTRVKRGTKIDNLVQIGHNAIIGEDCIIVAQVAIAGSCEIGDRVMIAGQVGIVSHVKVGSDSKIGAQSGVHTNIPDKSVVLGSPPQPVREELQRIAYSLRLPQLFKEVKALKKKIESK